MPPSCLWFFFSSRRRHTRCLSDWSSDVCSSDLCPSSGSFSRSRFGGSNAESRVYHPLQGMGPGADLGPSGILPAAGSGYDPRLHLGRIHAQSPVYRTRHVPGVRPRGVRPDPHVGDFGRALPLDGGVGGRYITRWMGTGRNSNRNKVSSRPDSSVSTGAVDCAKSSFTTSQSSETQTWLIRRNSLASSEPLMATRTRRSPKASTTPWSTRPLL